MEFTRSTPGTDQSDSPSLENAHFSFNVDDSEKETEKNEPENKESGKEEHHEAAPEKATHQHPDEAQQGGFPFPEYGYARPTEFAPGWQKRLAIGGTLLAAAIGGLLYIDSQQRETATENEPIPATATATGEEFQRFPELFTSHEQLQEALESGRLDKNIVEIENLASGLYSYELTESVEYQATNGRGRQVTRQRAFTSYYRGVGNGAERNELLRDLTERGYSITPASKGQTIEGSSSYSMASTIIGGIIACALVGGLIYTIRQRRMQQKQQRDAFSQFTKPNDGNAVEHPTDGFESLGGMSHVIEEMQEIKEDILRVKSGDSAISLPRGIILSGPPGTGKTALVRALAGETVVPVLRVDGSRLTNMLKGTGPASIARGFKEARDLRTKETEEEKERQNNPQARGVVILLIDEIDSVATSRNMEGNAMDNDDERKNIVNTLLQEMDGIDPLRNKDIIVMGTTNFGTTLDAALMRPGRFSVKRNVPLPASTEERLDILTKLHERIVVPSGISIADPGALEQLAAITQQKSGDELRAMLQDAVRLADREQRTEVTTDDLFESYQRLSFGRIRDNYLSTDEKALVAAHELGHGVMAIAGNIPLFLVSMMARGETGGRVIIDPRAMGEVLQNQQALLSRVLVGVGGQAAERFVYGKQGITTGASGDLTQIRGLMRQMISVGMFEELYDQDISRQPDHMLKAQHSKVINELVSNAMLTADTILEAIGDDAFKELIDESIRLDRELTGAEAQALFDRHINPEAKERIRSIAGSFIIDPLTRDTDEEQAHDEDRANA